MSNKFKSLLAAFNYPRTLPVYLCVLASKQRKLIEMDVARWNKIEGIQRGLYASLNWYMTYKKDGYTVQKRCTLPLAVGLR